MRQIFVEYNFAVDIAKFVTQAVEDADRFVTKVVGGLIDEINVATPVGIDGEFYPEYLGGNLRKNWQLGVDNAPSKYIDGVDPSGQSTVSNNKSKIPKKSTGHTYYLVNNAVHANVIEYGLYEDSKGNKLNSKNVTKGFSKKAPEGMVEKTVISFDKIVAKSL